MGRHKKLKIYIYRSPELVERNLNKLEKAGNVVMNFVPGYPLLHKLLTPRRLSILMILKYENWMSLRRIQEYTALPSRTIYEDIRLLLKNGLVRRKKVGRKSYFSNSYSGIVINIDFALSSEFDEFEIPEITLANAWEIKQELLLKRGFLHIGYKLARIPRQLVYDDEDELPGLFFDEDYDEDDEYDEEFEG